ncbi:MAG: PEP-CTERM sorting domain-containing protein [candidate division Zixibacteria bacterium]|nr:PEP-CTERM sorting domain-containing protein [candidate division Zixibacteria bacterium]MBU1470702.1 PEP-CTERM sorting domain-containing protein [candidate division Zixibacteria bacterium]MBU2624992.1 PEP-CTERM sorting domain-containing protein [candidate division Zixibacteria bacterium]
MKDKLSTSNLGPLTVSALVIVLLLCLTWTPVYGFNFSRIDNVAGGTGGSDNGNGTGTKGSDLVLTTGTGINQPATGPSPGTGNSFLWGNEAAYDNAAPACPPIPEPTTLILIGLGLAGGSLYRKIRS